MNNALLFITSGIISFCAYFLIIIALVFSIFRSNPTHYSAFNESALALHAISIEAILDDKPTPSKSPKPAINNPLAGSGIKDMFDKIDSDLPSQNAAIGDDREKVEQNSKEQKLKELQSSAESLQNKLNSLSNLTISANTNQSDGEYDEWYAQIEKIMFEQWQVFNIEEKLQALVHIRIADNGIFSYKVVKYSGNIAFDDSIKTALEECTRISFPPHPKGKKEIAITFKN